MTGFLKKNIFSIIFLKNLVNHGLDSGPDRIRIQQQAGS
jgi:hypothetical protein